MTRQLRHDVHVVNHKCVEQTMATLGGNDVVGELSLIDRRPRTATVTATEGCELLVMHTVT